MGSRFYAFMAGVFASEAVEAMFERQWWRGGAALLLRAVAFWYMRATASD